MTGFDRDRLIALLGRDALRTGSFTLASGRTSHYYVDGRKVTLSAEGASVIGQGVLGLLADLPSVAAVGGLTMGADPIVGATPGPGRAGGPSWTSGVSCPEGSQGARHRPTGGGPARGRNGRGHS